MINVLFSIALILGQGLIFSLWGNKLFYPLMTIAGSIIGLYFGITLSENIWVGLAIGIGIGVIYALFVKFLHRATLGFTGALLGFLLTMQLLSFLPMITEPITYIVSGVVALVTCVLFVRSSNWIIKAYTSAYGAGIIAPVILFLKENISNLATFETNNSFLSTLFNVNSYVEGSITESNIILTLVLIVILTVFGLMMQRDKNSKHS